jgi:hypothetical protein
MFYVLLNISPRNEKKSTGVFTVYIYPAISFTRLLLQYVNKFYYYSYSLSLLIWIYMHKYFDAEMGMWLRSADADPAGDVK